MLPLRALAQCIALAGATGLRAFVPFFYLALALRLHLFPTHALNRHFVQYVDLAHSDGTFMLLGLLTLAELCIEKIVAWSEHIDLPLLMLRVLGAITIAFAVMPIDDLGTALTAAILTGAVGAVPIVNLHARQHSHDSSRLPAHVNFASSLLLDGVSLLVGALALQEPYVAVAILHPLCWVAALLVNRWSAVHLDLHQALNMPEAPEFPSGVPGAGRAGRE